LHPARRYPLRTLALLLFVGALGLLLGHLLPPLTALALLAMLVFNLSEHFLPSRYRFDDEGFEVRRGPWRHAYSWTKFKGYCPDRNGILLSPFSVRHSLEAFRGTFLALERGDKERLIAWLSPRLKRLP
ncbi:unnamed protein product, partial [Phaeothamnion confervicola]